MFDYGTHSYNTSELVENLWYHMSLIIRESNFTLFFNGTLILEDDLDAFLLSASETYIYLAGAFAESSGDNSDLLDTTYEGLMQDMGIFSRSLTMYEISMLAIGTNSLSGATFLPQCICAEDEGVMEVNEAFCSNGTLRYSCKTMTSIAVEVSHQYHS